MKEETLHYGQNELINDPDLGALESDEDLLGSGLLDSLGMMRLVGYIEERFELKIPMEDMVIENFESIDTLVSYLEKKL